MYSEDMLHILQWPNDGRQYIWVCIRCVTKHVAAGLKEWFRFRDEACDNDASSHVCKDSCNSDLVLYQVVDSVRVGALHLFSYGICGICWSTILWIHPFSWWPPRWSIFAPCVFWIHVQQAIQWQKAGGFSVGMAADSGGGNAKGMCGPKSSLYQNTDRRPHKQYDNQNRVS